MRWYRNLVSKGARPGLMCLDEALQALGEDGEMGPPQTAEVPLIDVVGTMHRSSDFDRDFRLANECLRDRWECLAAAMDSGFEPPPVRLVQLGELYFVVDGHHRISVARALGRSVIAARVRRICTIAYATCCLRPAHLPSKAAERQFLRRVPLPHEIRRDLWLDEPAQWRRLSDAAEAWGLRRSMERGRLTDRGELAVTWWAEEVAPVVDRLRAAGVGHGSSDVELYATSLAVRDRLGHARCTGDLIEHF